MSHDATKWAIRQKGLKPATKIVLWHLCDRHHPDNGCFPKQETLAADCEMSRSTLNLHLAKLEELGLIRRDAGREQGTMKHRPTRYWLAFEGENPVSENRTKTVSENRTEPTKTVSEKRTKPCPKNDDIRVLKPDTNSVREPIREPVSVSPLVPQPTSDAETEAPEPKARLPSGWALSDEGWAYARSQHIPDEVIHDEARGFHAYWSDRRDRDARKSARGWEQCWAGWCRRIATRYRARGGMAGQTSANGYGQGGSIASIAARRRATGQV